MTVFILVLLFLIALVFFLTKAHSLKTILYKYIFINLVTDANELKRKMMASGVEGTHSTKTTVK